eukprot:scpid13661/ scgid27361/ 
MNLFEDILGRFVLQDDNTARIRTNDNEVFRSSCQAKGHQRANDTEHFNGQHGNNFTSVGIRTKELQDFLSSRHNNFLLFSAREIALNGAGDGSWALQSDIVKIHDCFYVPSPPLSTSHNPRAQSPLHCSFTSTHSEFSTMQTFKDSADQLISMQCASKNV